MANRLVSVDDNLHLPPAVLAQLTDDVRDEFTTYVTDAEDAATAATTAASTATTSATAAETAADEAVAAAASITVPTDTLVDDRILVAQEDGKIPVADDLVARYLTNANSIVIGHRGGALLYPEHSREGYRASYLGGFHIEVDLRALSDGTLVPLHDATVDRTMRGVTGSASTLTLAEWRQATINPAVAGGAAVTPPTWNEVLDEFGGRALIFAELKDTGTTFEDAVMASVRSRGLSRSVVFQTFDFTAASRLASEGFTVVYLMGSTLATPASTIAAAGISYIGASTGFSGTDVAALEALGIETIIYTVNTRAEYATQQAKAVFGVFSDDPWWITNMYAKTSTPPWINRVGWPGLTSRASNEGELPAPTPLPVATRASYKNAGLGKFILDPVTGVTAYPTLSASQRWAGARSTSMVARFALTLLPTAVNQTRWAGVFIGQYEDAGFYDGSTATVVQSGYHIIFRRDGNATVYTKLNSGAAASIGTLTVPVTAAGTARTLEIKVELTATQVIVTELVSGATVTITNSAYRTNMALAFTANGQVAEFSDVYFD